MEVQSFLNTANKMSKNLYSDSFYEISNARLDSVRAGWCDKLTHILKLHSMPFYKEAVLEIFKYWYKSEYKDYVNVKGNCIMFRENEYTIRTDKDNPATALTFSIPKTIDDFINDCHRAGVELLWREDIANKYFR